MRSTNYVGGWLLLLYTLPAKKSAGRVSLWRKLKKMGACLLKTSAYVLPDEPAHFERFQWLVQQVREEGGEATLARVTRLEGLSNDELARLFNEARAEDYAGVGKSLGQLLSANRKKIAPDFPDVIAKLRRQFQDIRGIDYFACPVAHDVELLFARADALSRPKAKSPAVLETQKYQGRQWLTRPSPEIDRVGSAWLIRRFIDPRAEFVFARDLGAHPDALPYDMNDVEFTHHGDDCTFETLLKRFAIANPAAQRIGQMIHDADLEDEKFGRPECTGLDLVFKGWAKQGLADADILEKGFACFDALHAALSRKSAV
ncbi:MAG: hypothetical protein RIQ79_182 [Verrucomicrobiota bacterium]|jgi:hypothetical protein